VFENTDQAAAVGFCSDATSPVTTAFDYGDGVCSFSGVRNGQLCWYDNKNARERHTLICARCSSSASPFLGAYVFNHGSSAFLTCDTARFSINATTALPNPANATATTSISSSQPTQTQGNNITSSGALGKWATICIVVGVISGIFTIVGVPFEIVRYLRRRSCSKPSPNRTTSPNHFHFHGEVHLHDCVFQGTGAGEGSREGPPSHPRACVAAQLERAHHQLLPEEAKGSNGSWA
jgi:hypothetical protein